MEKHERKSRTSKLRRIETGIWFLIIVVFISIGIFVLNKYENSFETHKIYMPDVDGLIVGSPVNLMGIPVGYVTKTKIINDDEVNEIIRYAKMNGALNAEMTGSGSAVFAIFRDYESANSFYGMSKNKYSFSKLI